MSEQQREVPVRLTINVGPETAAQVASLRRGSRTITSVVNRAIAVWAFVEGQRAQGNGVAVIERHKSGERVREVLFVD